MQKQTSLSNITKIVGIIGSLLAILVYFLPYVTFTPQVALELSLLDDSIKPDMAVIDMFRNGTGAVVGWTGSILLFANIVMLCWRRQIWLEFLCVFFQIIPLFLILGAGANLFSVARHGIGYYLNIITLLILSLCLLADYISWAVHLKKPRKYCLAGLIVLCCGIGLPSIFEYLSIVGLIVLVPIGIILIISGCIGLISSKNKDSDVAIEEEEVLDDVSNSTEIETIESDDEHPSFIKRKRFYIIGCVIVISLVIIGLCIKMCNRTQAEEAYEWRTVSAETTDIFKTTDGYLGKESLITIPQGTRVEVLRYEPDSIWAFVRYTDRRDAVKCTGYVALSDLIDPDAQIESNVASETEPTVTSYESHEEEFENDWDYTTTDTFEGYIDDKYAIEMVLNRLDGNLWGSYRYKKNDTWIRLDGERGEGTKVILTEYVDDRCTGRFEGWYNDSDIVGEWISADEERRMPFKVELKSRQEP